MIAKIRGIPKTEWSQQISEKIAESSHGRVDR